MQPPRIEFGTRLEELLAAAADALVAIVTEEPDKWAALCSEEASTLTGLQQYWDAFGIADSLPPAYLLGSKIIEIFAARYPHLAVDDEMMGTA
jgi:hypothetical protein